MFLCCCCSETIDASSNHVPVQKNEETTENGIHPELAKVINACISVLLLYILETQSLHPLSETKRKQALIQSPLNRVIIQRAKIRVENPANIISAHSHAPKKKIYIFQNIFAKICLRIYLCKCIDY